MCPMVKYKLVLTAALINDDFATCSYIRAIRKFSSPNKVH